MKNENVDFIEKIGKKVLFSGRFERLTFEMIAERANHYTKSEEVFEKLQFYILLRNLTKERIDFEVF